jgi:hypothetical protein
MARIRPNSDSVLMEKPSSGKRMKGADQRNRHGRQRNQGWPPSLQEDVHHQDNEKQRLKQRQNNLVHAGGNRQGGVIGNNKLHILRESLGKLGHSGAYSRCRFHGVRSRQLVNGHAASGSAIVIER